VNNTVLTPCARNGIFRYVPGLVNGNATALASSPANTPQRVVGVDGSPLYPVRYVSVFGPIDYSNFPASVAPDCSNVRLLNGSLTGASKFRDGMGSQPLELRLYGFRRTGPQRGTASEQL
jgi:hypothetical protein